MIISFGAASGMAVLGGGGGGGAGLDSIYSEAADTVVRSRPG
jgi:hypothetical protein